MQFSLPRTATAPFCPAEIRGTVALDPKASFLRRLFVFMGPALLVSVGYMDPGNWATDIAAGSRFGYGLLPIVLFSSLSAIVLQCLCARIGIVTGKDLAQLCRDGYGRRPRLFLWIMAEISIIACDVAEVLGCALAFSLLFGLPLLWGVGLTALDTLIVLGLKGRHYRTLEAIVLGLISTIGLCFAAEIWMLGLDWAAIADGMVPRAHILLYPEAIPLAVGIIGATVMPHNLYLHSSVVQTRTTGESEGEKIRALRLGTVDTTVSLSLAFLINAAILILAARAFHAHGQFVTEIQDAYTLLSPIAGSALGGILFALALLAAGQSSTFTGTIAGQVIMDGFLNIRIPCWQRRLITRGLALIPAFLGISALGEAGVGKMLVISQIVLSLQLPFAVYPLIRFSSDRSLMGIHRASLLLRAAAWCIFLSIVGCNAFLLCQFM